MSSTITTPNLSDKEEVLGEDVSEHNGDEVSDEEINNYNSQVLDVKSKNIIWSLLKQVKVGATIKHLQLPTFVLQPVSLLEKMADLFSYPDIISSISKTTSAEERFINVVRFYLSGIHIRPKGVKSPLNPVLGETFRCEWPQHKSQYVAEQISHHPPYSAFCFYNVDQGIALNANFAPSYVKYYGNWAETCVGGFARMVVVHKNFEEVYDMTWPSMQVKGIMVGALTTELFGKVTIRCEQTQYKAEIDFKKKPLWRGKYNQISGKIKKGSSTLYGISGYWDSDIFIAKPNSKDSKIFFSPYSESEFKIQPKSVPPLDQQEETNSRRVWSEVIRGIVRSHEQEALSAKVKIEEQKRKEEQERVQSKTEWIPKLFVKKHLLPTEVSWVHCDWENMLKKIREIKQK